MLLCFILNFVWPKPRTGTASAGSREDLRGSDQNWPSVSRNQVGEDSRTIVAADVPLGEACHPDQRLAQFSAVALHARRAKI
jgi:hypothetical protein